MADEVLTVVKPGETLVEGGDDYRNYGLLAGIPEARAFFAEYMGCDPAEVVIGGNSSLNLMYDAVANAMRYGVPTLEGRDADQVRLPGPRLRSPLRRLRAPRHQDGDRRPDPRWPRHGGPEASGLSQINARGRNDQKKYSENLSR